MPRRKINSAIVVPFALGGALLLGTMASAIAYFVYPAFFPEPGVGVARSVQVKVSRARGAPTTNVSRSGEAAPPLDRDATAMVTLFIAGVVGFYAGWFLGMQAAERRAMRDRHVPSGWR